MPQRSVRRALSSLAMVAAIAAILAAQAAFTFAAILESERLTRTTVSRDAAAREYRTLEALLYRQRLAERAYIGKPAALLADARYAAFTAFRAQVARLQNALPPARLAQLDRLEKNVVEYERISARAMARAAAGDPAAAQRVDEREVEPRYAQLSTSLAGAVRDFDRRTAQLDAQGMAMAKRLAFAAGGVLTFGLLLVGALLAMLESYRRNAQRAMELRVESLRASLHTDALTGLANDRAFHERVMRLFASDRSAASPAALLLLDIDDFKSVNDARGRRYGDDVLVDLATALTRERSGAAMYRLGGDRFAMLWEGPLDAPHAAAEHAYTLASCAMRGLTVSAGYSEAHAQEPDCDLLECAQAALRSAKRKGGNVLVDFRDVEAGVFVFSAVKAQAVRRILNRRQMPMSFQPIVDAHTGRAIAYEALARPEEHYGLRGPEEMFDIAENLYKTFDLDGLCVRSALRFASERLPDALIFINVVPSSLESEQLDLDLCVDTMRKAGIVPGNVVLELTERKISNHAALAARIDDLRERGFRVALDDTGAGYAGLDVLSKMTFDFVKIDRLLILRAMSDERARGVLCGILAIAQETRSTVIAEGIETHDMLAFARGFRVRSLATSISALQGYVFGAPEHEPAGVNVTDA